MKKSNKINKVVLAYSGGLDTSVILKWLQDVYGCEVITFTADIGQGEEVAPARKKAQLMGVKQIFIEDLREEFVRDFVFPMFRANTLYEGEYLLGTSIARPLIAKRMIDIARNKLAAQPTSQLSFAVADADEPLFGHGTWDAVLAFNLLGDGLRDALDPKLKR